MRVVRNYGKLAAAEYVAIRFELLPRELQALNKMITRLIRKKYRISNNIDW